MLKPSYRTQCQNPDYTSRSLPELLQDICPLMQRLEKKQEKPSPILFRDYFLLISWGILGTAAVEM